jgi:hypothetical protein
MKCFRLQVVSDDLQVQNQFDELSSTFFLPRCVWQGILRFGNTSEALATLNKHIEVKCGVCGSFLVPAGPFFTFVQKIESIKEDNDDFYEIVGESLCDIYRALLETKFNDEKALLKYWQDGGGDHRLLKGPDGDLVFDEVTGWPLGLAFDDVAVMINSSVCPSCHSLFKEG